MLSAECNANRTCHPEGQRGIRVGRAARTSSRSRLSLLQRQILPRSTPTGNHSVLSTQYSALSTQHSSGAVRATSPPHVTDVATVRFGGQLPLRRNDTPARRPFGHGRACLCMRLPDDSGALECPPPPRRPHPLPWKRLRLARSPRRYVSARTPPPLTRCDAISPSRRAIWTGSPRIPERPS